VTELVSGAGRGRGRSAHPPQSSIPPSASVIGHLKCHSGQAPELARVVLRMYPAKGADDVLGRAARWRRGDTR